MGVGIVMMIMVVVIMMMLTVIVIIIVINLKVLQFSIQVFCSVFLIHALVPNRLLQALDVDLVLDHIFQQVAGSSLPIVECLDKVRSSWLELRYEIICVRN